MNLNHPRIGCIIYVTANTSSSWSPHLRRCCCSSISIWLFKSPSYPSNVWLSKSPSYPSNKNSYDRMWLLTMKKECCTGQLDWQVVTMTRTKLKTRQVNGWRPMWRTDLVGDRWPSGGGGIIGRVRHIGEAKSVFPSLYLNLRVFNIPHSLQLSIA